MVSDPPRYRLGEPQCGLEDWPFTNPLSGYTVLRGAPRASGRLDQGGQGQPTRLGVWHCTEGAFECTEIGDELQSILSGRVRVTWIETGTSREFGPGDSFFTRQGERVVWDVIEDVTKAFFGYRPERF